MEILLFFGIVMLVVQGTFKYAYLNFQKKEAVSSSKISGEIEHLDKYVSSQQQMAPFPLCY